MKYYGRTRIDKDQRKQEVDSILILDRKNKGKADAREIYYAVMTTERYTSYIAKYSRMDMMYMPDVLDAISDFMGADSYWLMHRQMQENRDFMPTMT